MGRGVPLPKDLSEFSDPKYWDAFFKARGGRPFEWYGDWKLISKLVIEKCGLKSSSREKILIPGCGNSTLSADMYDAGFLQITNIDFSRVVISEMLRQHVRSRPSMRWLVMDMTKMQLPDESFDVVVDKGGLDALLGDPEDDRSSGVSFLSEVKRVLKPSGWFACITLVQQHVIELLLHTFREGWQLSVHGLQLSVDDSPSSLQPFLVVAQQNSGVRLPMVSFDVDLDWRGLSNSFQLKLAAEAVDAENALRSQGPVDSGLILAPEKNSQDSYRDLHPGRRLTTKLGGQESQFTCTVVVLDAKEDATPDYQSAVFLVPKGRAHEWLFSSVEGQWQVAESTNAGRLVMISLDPNQYADDIMHLKDDLSLLVKCLLPSDSRESGLVPFVTQGDGIAEKKTVAQVDSSLTGFMVVEDVVLADENARSGPEPIGASVARFRRLVFRRSPNLIQSEALLVRSRVSVKSEDKGMNAKETRHKHSSGKKKKRVTEVADSLTNSGTLEQLKVDHSFLASSYHAGMIAAFVLIANNLEQWLASKQQIRLMVVGLGAGLLPMFVKNHVPVDDIQIVELDPVVGDVAKQYFGFVEDDRMRLEIGDGLAAVKNIAATIGRCNGPLHDQDPERRETNLIPPTEQSSASGNSSENRAVDTGPNRQVDPASLDCSDKLREQMKILGLADADEEKRTSTNGGCRVHILIVDADSEDPSSGLSCPPPEFLDDSFLLEARTALADGGMLVMNVVSRASSHHVRVVTQLKRLFAEVYTIELSEDVNRVLMALPQERSSGKSPDIMEDLLKFQKLAEQLAPWDRGPNLKVILRDLKRLK